MSMNYLLPANLQTTMTVKTRQRDAEGLKIDGGKKSISNAVVAPYHKKTKLNEILVNK